MVEVKGYGFGVVQWMGTLRGTKFAGVELEEYRAGCGDGTPEGGVEKLFPCQSGHSVFSPVADLVPDSRFMAVQTVNPLHHVPEERVAERTAVPRPERYSRGRQWGIQGEHNSCNIDAALFGLLSIECSGEKELKKEVEQLSDAQDSNHQLQIQCQQKTDQLQLEQLSSQQLQQQLEQEQGSKAQLQQQLEQEQHRKNQVEVQLQQLQQQLQQEQQRARNLQERLDRSAGEMLNMRPATAVLMNVAFFTAKRSEVKTGAIIGEGAWGKVERGVFKGSTVAVKSIHTAILKQNTVERLRREINIMAQVRHPNLVRFIAAVLDGPAERLQAPPMIITELMDINLRQAYEEKRVVPAHYLTILRDVAYGLHHLHSLQQPIIHRDVSAPNVLLQQQPNGGWLAKVSDFGSANFAKQARTAGEGAIIYSAPETFPSTVSDPDSEPPLLTTKVDVFSYGVVACELVTGEMPASDKYRAMLRKVEKKWAFMHGLIVRCTKRSPLERPSMADILDELPQPIPRLLK
jgi:multidrug efflux pump subunit AcrA (membrane-fusion protein)